VEKGPKKLRKHIISKEPNQYLLSLLHWNTSKNFAIVYMTSERVEMMKREYWCVVPVRLDSWDIIGPALPINMILE
jgi:hypothetical protein